MKYKLLTEYEYSEIKPFVKYILSLKDEQIGLSLLGLQRICCCKHSLQFPYGDH